MFEVCTDNLAEMMRQSSNYKVLRHDGWIYVVPVLADFDVLAADLNSNEWDKVSVLIIDEQGVVRKNRYGPVSEEDV